MIDISNPQWLNFAMGLLLKKIVVPTDFRGQCAAVDEILRDDVSGLVDSLTDFSVETASVNFTVESDNEEYSRIINKWLKDINKEYKGRIPTGIDALAKEYYKERWKGSSFPVLKMGNLKRYDNGLMLPTRMFFVDGSSINAKEKNTDKVRHLLNYDYFLGNNSKNQYKLDGDNVIFSRPYGRWFDKYPIPYLVKRGVYHNWKIIESIKNKQTEILDQIIPYMLLVKKGSAELVKENIKAGYTDPELTKVKERIQELMTELKGLKSSSESVKSPLTVTNFDEQWEHLIPNLENIFKPELTQTAERNILSALGFIDVVEATSSSRKESVLNPKAFIEETKSGVKGFKEVIQQIMYYVQEENKSHKKYMNADTHIVNSPVKGFMTDEFKRQVKRLFDAGKVSSQTAVELIAEVDFETEIIRKKAEAKKGVEYIMTPPIIQPTEDKESDIPEEKPTKKKDKTVDKNGKEVTEDKTNKNEKKEYNIGADDDSETAAYKNIKDLPHNVKKNLPSSLQKVFMIAFNQTYGKYQNDTQSFRAAWGIIKKISKKNDKGKWVNKSNKVKITKAVIEKILDNKEINKEE